MPEGLSPTEDGTAKLMRAGLNLIQQALSIYDSDLRLVSCNARFQEVFGLPDALVTPGARFWDTIHFLVHRGEYGPVDDVEDAIRSRVDMARAFKPHYMERQRSNGRWISVEGSPLPQGGWVTVYTDITEIKHQERLLRARSEELTEQLLVDAERISQANRALAATNAALEEAKRELTEMEARTRLTTEMMPAHIAHVGPDLRYTYSNRRLSSVLPGRPQNIIGLHGREALGATAFERIAPYLDNALLGTPSVFEFTDDDSGRRIRVAFTPDQPAPGTINGVYILSMDVTEEAQARAALAQTHKRELAAQLTSGLAHDFANLLTIILGLQSRLGRMDALPEGAANLVQGTIAAARRGGALLDRIGSISGRRELRPEPVNVARLLADLRVLAEPTLAPDTSLRIACAALPEALMLDPGALQDALLNVILNARDALGSAGDTGGTIRVAARTVRDTWLEFAVTDTGPGFSPEALRHGLDPFFTTKGVAGSGLGLAMVYDQVKLAGGSVRLANATGGGAVVTLRLPLRRAEPVPAARMVLLVEDTDELRADIREYLRDLGHAVIEATTAEEALALADLPEIDMVLSDINLPGGRSGLDLAQALRAEGHGADLRLMTALPPGDATRAAAAAAFPVLSKPFGRDDLARFIGGAAA